MTNSDKKAMVVAISDYDNKNLENLSFCKNDGNSMAKILRGLGYEIKTHDELIGCVNGTVMKDKIVDFFTSDEIKSTDTIIFYFSGHGIVGVSDDVYLASSDIDLKAPTKRGFSFNDLTTMIESCASRHLIVILDCCYGGSAKISKGEESFKVLLATNLQTKKINSLKQGIGKCLLSASLGFQEAFPMLENEHSYFTYYLMKGLNGADGKSVDNEGCVTPATLMDYIDSELDAIPKEKRPHQTPLRKIETTGKIILATYPNLATKSTVKNADVYPVKTSYQHIRVTKERTARVDLHYQMLFAPDRLIFANVGADMKKSMGREAAGTIVEQTLGFFPIVGGIAGSVASSHIKKKLRTKTEVQDDEAKSEVFSKLSVDDLLRLDKHNFTIPYYEIKEIKLKKYLVGEFCGQIEIRTDKKLKFEMLSIKKFDECAQIISLYLGGKIKK